MYIGKTHRILQDKGWNANPDVDNIPPGSMTEVDNINIHRGGRQPRGGTDKVNTSALSGAPEITGLYHFIRENGQLEGSYVIDESSDNIGDENGNMLVSEGSYVMAGTSDGKIYTGFETELKSGLTENTKFNFETFYDECYIANGVDKPQVYGANLDYTWDIGSPIACTAALAGAGAGNVDDGTHSYKITFVSSSGESTGGTASNVVTVADKTVNGQISLTSIPTGPTGTTSRKVYRTVAGDTGDYKLVTTISDNTTTTYTDNTADSGLGAAAPTTSLAFLPTDWQSDWPKYFIKHGRGQYKRLWAFGCESYPNAFYASVDGVLDFSDTNVIKIRIMTDKITAAVDFGGNLIAFSRDSSYIINDVPIVTAYWGYNKAVWDGGAAHQNLVVRTPNDVVAMDESGNIYSIRASEKYGDYEIASLTKPYHIDKWIHDNIDLLQIDKFHAVYDADLRAIKFFMVESGYGNCNVCLVYFIDYAAWTKHNFENIAGTYIYHVSSALIKINESVWKIYTGGVDGFAYALEADTFLDVDTIYSASFKSVLFPIEHPRLSKLFDRFWLGIKPVGTETLIVRVYVDGNLFNTYEIQTSGASESMQNILFYLGITGIRIQVEVECEDGDDFFINDLMFDYQVLGSSDEYAAAVGSIYISEAAYHMGGINSSSLTDNDSFDPQTNTWAGKTDMPSPARNLLHVDAIDGKGYAIAGGTELDNDEYTHTTNTWENRTDKPDEVRAGAIFATGNTGYIAGGIYSVALLDTDEYNSTSMAWTVKADMPSPARWGLTGLLINSLGYTFGGLVGTAGQSDTDEYNITGNSWSSKTNIPSPARYGTASFEEYDKGYLAGGGQTTSIEIQDTDEYDQAGDSWTSKTNIPSPSRDFISGTTARYKGYIFGGEDGGSKVQDTDEYATSDVWVSKANMPSPGRERGGACTL